MDWLYGSIGFAGFEALRLYKRVCSGIGPIPGNRYVIYGISVVGVCAFSGILAQAALGGCPGQSRKNSGRQTCLKPVSGIELPA